MSQPFDPYHQWLGIPPKHQPANHYRLLGIELFEESAEVIEHAADQRMAHLRSLQAGQHSQWSQTLLNEVAAARVCLLNPGEKARYDAEIKAKLDADRPGRVAGEKASGRNRFGPYILLEELDRGRTGWVFKAKHQTMGRIVALKILSAEATTSPVKVERFRRKVKILTRLSHANLVMAFDAGVSGKKHFLVMEYVDGRDLGSLVKTRGPLPVAQAVDYITQAARGLGYAHGQGFYHRNVEPSNLLVDKEGIVKVIGLGLAAVDLDVIEEDTSLGTELTLPGSMLGTADYMAPEQAVDSHAADHRADIYALGCTLCALLTGHSPYPVKSVIKKIAAHRDHPIPSLRAERPEVPQSLDAVFMKMLAKRPEDRYQSMEEVVTALQAC